MEELLAKGEVWVHVSPLKLNKLLWLSTCTLWTSGNLWIVHNLWVWNRRKTFLVSLSLYLAILFLCAIAISRRRCRYKCHRPSKRIKADPQRCTHFPGYQFLETSHRTCNEGSPIFFKKNYFHLPPGDLLNTNLWFDGLREEQKAAIKGLICDFSLFDLGFSELWITYLFAWVYCFFTFRRRLVAGIWSSLLMFHLQDAWEAKIEFIKKWERQHGKQSLTDTAENTKRQAYNDLRHAMFHKAQHSGLQATWDWLIQRDFSEDLHRYTSMGVSTRP